MQEQIFTLPDAVRGIYTRKRLVIGFFFGTLFLVGLITLVVPPKYTSEAKLFMRLGRENTGLDATATLGEHPVVMMPQSREAEINSIVELIQSKQLFESIVDKVGAEKILKRKANFVTEGGDESESEESWVSGAIDSVMGTLVSIGVLNDVPRREKAVIKLKKNIEVEALEKSNVLTVSIETHTPELAQQIIQHLIDEYKNQHVKLHRPPKAYEFLKEQTDRLSVDLAKERRRLEALKNETGILDTAQERKVLIDLIAKLRAQVLMAATEESSLSTEVQKLTQSIEGLQADIPLATTVGAGNEGADGMRQQLFQLEVQREQLASALKFEHPKMSRIDQQMQRARTILKDTEKDRVEKVMGPNKVVQDLDVKLKEKSSQLAAAQSRKQTLIEQVQQAEQDLVVFTGHEREFAQLEQSIEILRANYGKYALNLEQANIDTKMKEEQFSNVSVAQAATLNLKPSSPNKLLNLLLAIALGTTGGCSLAIILEYLKTTADFDASKSRSGPRVDRPHPVKPTTAAFGRRLVSVKNWVLSGVRGKKIRESIGE